jgi:hypothetical protein
MGAGAAIAIGGGALLLVFLLNKQRQAQTAAQIAMLQSQVYKPGTLSFGDAFNVAGTVVSVYTGGVAGGAAFVKGIK